MGTTWVFLLNCRSHLTGPQWSHSPARWLSRSSIYNCLLPSKNDSLAPSRVFLEEIRACCPRSPEGGKIFNVCWYCLTSHFHLSWGPIRMRVVCKRRKQTRFKLFPQCQRTLNRIELSYSTQNYLSWTELGSSIMSICLQNIHPIWNVYRPLTSSAQVL